MSVQIHTPQPVTIGALRRAGYNPRRISKEEMESLRGSLQTYGLVQNLVAQRDTHLLIGGHQRLDALVAISAADGLTPEQIDAVEVPVTLLDIDDSAAKALNLALNRISGEWDHDKLTELLQELQASAETAELPTGFQPEEIEDLLAMQNFGVARDEKQERTEQTESLDEDLRSQNLRVVIQFETQEQLEGFHAVLRHFGAQNTKALAGPLAAAMQALRDVLPDEPPPPPPKPKRQRKAKAPNTAAT